MAKSIVALLVGRLCWPRKLWNDHLHRSSIDVLDHRNHVPVGPSKTHGRRKRLSGVLNTKDSAMHCARTLPSFNPLKFSETTLGPQLPDHPPFDASSNLSSSLSLSWILVTSLDRTLVATLPERGSCGLFAAAILPCESLLSIGCALFTRCGSAPFTC